MKTITSTITGLASSLLLNAGLTRAAQSLDPLANFEIRRAGLPIRSAEFCVTPCNFGKRKA